LHNAKLSGHVRPMDDKKPLLSLEGAAGIFFGLAAAIGELSWAFRTILLGFAVGLAIHIARKLPIKEMLRFVSATIAIAILGAATWRPIWEGFHKDFPDVSGETVLSRIIMAAAFVTIGVTEPARSAARLRCNDDSRRRPESVRLHR
jgi:hypothetical protein